VWCVVENGKYVVPSPLEDKLSLSPIISQVVMYGDGKQFNIVMVVVDEVTLRGIYEESETKSEFNYEEEITKDEVVDMVRKEV